MADIPVPEVNDGSKLEACVGLSIVLLATFLGIANVKDNNIVQQMQKRQADRVNNWSWYQARNIRSTVYDAFSKELEVPWPNETPDVTELRKAKSNYFKVEAEKQETKMAGLKTNAEEAEADYNALNDKDDQFDLCEAALALGLALMGVTALVKRWWLFFVALVPAVFGVAMGVAGFVGIDTNTPAIKWIIQVLS